VGLPGVISQRFERVRAQINERDLSAGCPVTRAASRRRAPKRRRAAGVIALFRLKLRSAHRAFVQASPLRGTPTEAGARSRETRPAHFAFTDCHPARGVERPAALHWKCGAAGRVDAPGRAVTHRTTGLAKHAEARWRPPPWGRVAGAGRREGPGEQLRQSGVASRLACSPFFTAWQTPFSRTSPVTVF